MTINILSEEIINQIAAGEVIENPSAVIKELIENSIDAKSTQIGVELIDSGLTKIQVRDNGVGILKDELSKAPLRHATSKIKNFNDLYHINSMGFRGEALASIFSIAKTTLISKPKNQEQSYEINSENLTTPQISSGDNGTTIIVEDIFYNTPARKKYLRSERLELKSILDVVNRYLLIYKNIKFTLKHNGKILINKPIFSTNKDNLIYILGNDLKGNLIEIDNQQNGLKITGFISKPSSLTYPVKKNQFIFVNNRYVKSKVINDAIYLGFGTNLMESRHPLYNILIEIDPEIIDVNVHPTKIEIRFEDEEEIYKFVSESIKDVFKQEETFKEFEKPIEKDLSLEKLEDIEINKNINFKNIQEPKTYFNTETQKPLNVAEKTEQYLQNTNIEQTDNDEITEIENYKDNLEDTENFKKEINLDKEESNYGPLYQRLKDYRIVGQINKTFIILETPIEMIIVDQHVAEEKFYYENFKNQLENKKISSQNLLKSEVLNLSKSEFLLYKENLELIEKLGFVTEEFSENSIIVRSVPIGIRNKIISASILKDIIYEITQDKKFKLLEDEKIEKLASMACKKSIKAGHELTNIEIHKIIEQLKKLQEPFNCPHGRPILLNWKFTELEKKFKRIL